MQNPTSNAGQAATIRKTFRRETSVSVSIQADPAIVWALLTNAADYPRWNSTVVSLKGEIKQGGNIELKSTLDEKRTFRLKVREFEPEKRLVWGDSTGDGFIQSQRVERAYSSRWPKESEGHSFRCLPHSSLPLMHRSNASQPT